MSAIPTTQAAERRARSESAITEEIIEAIEKMIENQSYVKVSTNAEDISIEEFYKNGKD